MKTRVGLLLLILLLLPLSARAVEKETTQMSSIGTTVILPGPRLEGPVSVEAALRGRRSVREFSTQALSNDDLGQLLWAAQGITDSRGLRTAPSAGALYPLEIHVLVGESPGLAAGVYRYLPGQHALVQILQGDRRTELVAAALGQQWLRDNAAVLVFAAVQRRTARKYGRRAMRYIHMEAGHASQNVWLQATALGLGAAVAGAFNDAEVSALLELPAGEQALYLMAVGRQD